MLHSRTQNVAKACAKVYTSYSGAVVAHIYIVVGDRLRLTNVQKMRTRPQRQMTGSARAAACCTAARTAT